MLVMKALRQDVAILAFHPPFRTTGSQGSWDCTIVRPTEDLLLFPQMSSVGRVSAMVFDGASKRSPSPKGLGRMFCKEGQLNTAFAANVGTPLAGAQCVSTRRLISRPRKASIFHLRNRRTNFLLYLFNDYTSTVWH